MANWKKGERTVRFLIERGRLEILEAERLAEASEVLLERATRRVETASAVLKLDDIEAAYSAAYDAYRMAAEALLMRQGLRAAGGDGSHVAVEDAVSTQFGTDVPAFAKPVFEQLRRTRHTVQYFDPCAAPVTRADTAWAVEKATAALEGASTLLSEQQIERFDLAEAQVDPEHRPAGDGLVK